VTCREDESGVWAEATAVQRPKIRHAISAQGNVFTGGKGVSVSFLTFINFYLFEVLREGH
jgi:hypothetical protein